jgi:two-component system, LytTR family, response regulator
MKTIVIDDQHSARARLRRLLAKHPDIKVTAEACDGLDAIKKIEEHEPDLIFLDIEMPGLSGFQVLQSLKQDSALPLVIFITGYDQHALAAFDANALAYLLKPVEAERLAHALERARKLSATPREKDRDREHLLQVAHAAPKILRQIVCRKLDRLILLPPEQILWFQVERSIVKAHAATETYWVNHSLGELETSLPAEKFFRARREVLVNLQRIKEIRPYFKSGFLLVMSDAGATEIAVSERQARPLRQRIPGL